MKRLLLGFILLILFVGAALFLLDVTGVYPVENLQNQALEQANKLPAVKEYIILQEDLEKLQQQLAEVEGNLSAEEQENKKLQTQLQKKQQEITDLKEQIQELESKLTKRQENKQQYQDKVNNLAGVYNEMEPAKAAEVLANLRTDLTVDILNQVDNDVAAEILNQMPTDVAVEISNQVTTISQ